MNLDKIFGVDWDNILRQRVCPGARAPSIAGSSPGAHYPYILKQLFTNIITCQCWHKLQFLIRWPRLLALDARQLLHTVLHLFQQLLVDTKQLLSRSRRSLDGVKHVLVVVPETLTRRFINSWLTVDDHETAAKQRRQKANRNHSRSISALSIHM